MLCLHINSTHSTVPLLRAPNSRVRECTRSARETRQGNGENANRVGGIVRVGIHHDAVVSMSLPRSEKSGTAVLTPKKRIVDQDKNENEGEDEY